MRDAIHSEGRVEDWPPATCSASTSAELYRLLEYYRNFMPFCVGMSEKEYSATQEAKNADAALNAYRTETGVKADMKPSEPNALVRALATEADSP